MQKSIDVFHVDQRAMRGPRNTAVYWILRRTNQLTVEAVFVKQIAQLLRASLKLIIKHRGRKAAIALSRYQSRLPLQDVDHAGNSCLKNALSEIERL
jgi:hypothetical protein